MCEYDEMEKTLFSLFQLPREQTVFSKLPERLITTPVTSCVGRNYMAHALYLDIHPSRGTFARMLEN